MPVAVTSPVFVRNNMPGPTVLSTDPKGTESVEWAGKGDPNGGDIQMVSPTIANSVPFLRNVARGVFSLMEDETDPEALEAVRKQSEEWSRRNASAAQAAKDSIEATPNNDLVVVKCLGPGPCTVDVSVRERERNAKPALCERHADLASEYVPEQVQENGHDVTRWIRHVMNPRETQST